MVYVIVEQKIRTIRDKGKHNPNEFSYAVKFIYTTIV
jgi:hypothetical protein